VLRFRSPAEIPLCEVSGKFPGGHA
jgi:hypothetical protein